MMANTRIIQIIILTFLLSILTSCNANNRGRFSNIHKPNLSSVRSCEYYINNYYLSEFFHSQRRYPKTLDEMYDILNITPIVNPESELHDWITFREIRCSDEVKIVESNNLDYPIVRVKAGPGKLKTTSTSACQGFINTRINEFNLNHSRYPNTLEEVFLDLRIDPVIDPGTNKCDWLTVRRVTTDDIDDLVVSSDERYPIWFVRNNSFWNRWWNFFRRFER